MRPARPRTIPATIGRYHVLAYLGGGGMADVFRVARVALDGEFRRELALKRMKADPDADPAVFFEEAILSSKLTHPNIVQGLDFGRHEDAYFLVMELVEGVHLGQLAKYVKQTQGGPLSPGLVVHLAMKLCSALEYAHAEPHKVVHRDISPHNVLISIHGEVKLIDFGIAKFATRGHHTRTNQVRGKIAYMSPEQVEDRPLDHRSDLFALGILLYELLSGERPFRSATDRVIMKKIASVEYVPLDVAAPRINGVLVELVHRLLAQEPAGRPQSAREVRVVLEQLVEPGTDPVSELAGFARRAERGRADDASSESRSKSIDPDQGTWPSVSIDHGPLDDDLDDEDEDDIDDSILATEHRRAMRDLSSLPSEELRALAAAPPDIASRSAEPTPSERAPIARPSPPRRSRLVAALAALAMAAGLVIALLPRQGTSPTVTTGSSRNAPPPASTSVLPTTTEVPSAATTPSAPETGPTTAADADIPAAPAPPRTKTEPRASRPARQPDGAAASLEIVVTPWAHIWLDEEFLGLVEAPIENLKPGRHKLWFGQHVPKKRLTVDLEPGRNFRRYRLD